MDKFQYGGLLFEPSHYQTLSYIESKHNNKLFINPDFKKGKAGYMQLSPIAFADLKKQGFFKDREYNSLTPQEVLAGSMKYASRLGEHYGFTDPKWNAAAYNMGPSKAKELYDKYGGKLNKAVLDPAFPQTTKDYLFDYNYTTLTKDRHNNEDVNKMYDIIKADQDVNSLNIDTMKIKKTPKYFWGAIIQAAANKVKEEKAKDKAFMNSSNMGAAGTALGSVITSAGDAIGTQEDASKANVIQGAAVSTLGGLMSGGIMGGLIAAPTSLIKYSANAIAQGSRKESQQEAWINGHTTGIDTGTNYQFKMGGMAKNQNGMYSIEGYKKNSPDRNNAFNIIPGTNISMQNVLHKVLGIGSNGQKQIMMPGQQYNFGASTYVTEIPIKKETGGAPEVVPMAQITPLQASKDELVIHPNYDVTKTAARKTHAEYTKTGQNEKVSDTLQPLQRDQVGNVIAPGAYVVSNAKELKIPVALAKQISLGVDPAYYAKNEHLPEAKERNVADEFFNNKKEMTPAELLKSVLKKIPEPKRDSKTDMFAKQTSAMNKEARVPMLEIIKKTNDFLRNVNAPASAQDEQEAVHNPQEEMQEPNTVMYMGGVAKHQLGQTVMPSYLNYPFYQEPNLNGGNVITGALRTPGDGNPLPATADNSSPYLNPSITKDWRKDYLNTANSPEGAAISKYSKPAKTGSAATPDYMTTLLQQIQNRKYPGNANNAALAALANGFGASMLSALQNPTNEVYATNPTLMDRKFAPEDVNLRTRIYDNSLANRDAITLKGLESTGVSAQKSQFYLQSNDNVEKRNAAVLSAIQANNQLGRAKADAIDKNRRGIVDQNNANQKDHNRYLYNITKPLADTAGNIGNIYQQDAQNRMAFDDRKERDIVSVQQGQFMMDFLNKQSGVTPATSGTTNTSTIPIFKGTTQAEWEAFKKKYNIV